MFEFDYIIVGAGTAGCVIAARLAEDRDVIVAVVEAGGRDASPIISIPGANVITGSKPEYNWNYRTEPVPALGGRRLYWAQGKILGGSSTINGMMYLRGHARDYDGWAANGCEGWSYADLLPLFKRSETNERGESCIHGGSGPLNVSVGSSTAPVCDIFLEAAAEAGIPVVDDLNSPRGEAFGHVDLTIGNGRRSSASTAYLRPAMRRGNIHLFLQTPVKRILIEHGSAAGVEVNLHGQSKILRARREVVLCGGPVNSPQLLMLSGIGPADHLREKGIQVSVDNPSVGENLQNHTMYKLMYSTRTPVSAYNHLRPAGLTMAGWQYATGRRGVLGRGLFPTVGFINAEENDPDTEIQVCMAPAIVNRRGPGLLGILPRSHGFTLLLNAGVPHSRGQVRLHSANAEDHAAIIPDYFSDPRDLDILAKGAARVRDMIHGSVLGSHVDQDISSPLPRNTLDEIKADIIANAANHYHACGTCRMGADLASVVDPQLRVRGVDNLRVADTSIMPTMINANTCATAFVIGEKAADLIRAA